MYKLKPVKKWENYQINWWVDPGFRTNHFQSHFHWRDPPSSKWQVTLGASTCDISRGSVSGSTTSATLSGSNTVSSSAAGEGEDSTSGVGKEAKKASTKIETWRKFGITAPLLAAQSFKMARKVPEIALDFFSMKLDVWWLMMSALHAVCRLLDLFSRYVNQCFEKDIWKHHSWNAPPCCF